MGSLTLRIGDAKGALVAVPENERDRDRKTETERQSERLRER